MSTKKLKKKSVSIDSNESDVQADAEIQKTKNDKPNKTVKKIKKKVPTPTEKIKGVEDDKEVLAESFDNNKIKRTYDYLFPIVLYIHSFTSPSEII